MKAKAKKKVTKKRLKRGVDWHAWAWKAGDTWGEPGELFFWAENEKPNTGLNCLRANPTETGKWVRVRFVEVKP